MPTDTGRRRHRVVLHCPVDNLTTAKQQQALAVLRAAGIAIGERRLVPLFWKRSPVWEGGRGETPTEPPTPNYEHVVGQWLVEVFVDDDRAP